MVYTKKDISGLFEEITSSSVVSGNSSSVIASFGLQAWFSCQGWYTEDGLAYDDACEDHPIPGWDEC